MGEGSCGLGKNQRGLRVGCCEMVGDYCNDSSVEENLNLLLRLTRVEANVDSKITKQQRILEGRLQGTQMLGASLAALSNDRLHKRFQRFKTRSAHSRVVRRLLEVWGSRGELSRFKLRK